MADGETLSIGGITITATAAITAEELATYFELYNEAADYGTAQSLTDATITGTWSGFTVADGGSATTVAITNGGRSDLNPLTVTGTASGTGADVKITATGTAGVDNAGAFGRGVLYYGAGVTAISISSAGGASQAVSELDLAINGAAAERAKYGAYMSRLQHASDNLANIATNTSASLSQIADADYAVETTELARTQIISQASTAMLAQANQVKQTVLALLQ
jgi:flagellin